MHKVSKHMIQLTKFHHSSLCYLLFRIFVECINWTPPKCSSVDSTRTHTVGSDSVSKSWWCTFRKIKLGRVGQLTCGCRSINHRYAVAAHKLYNAPM